MAKIFAQVMHGDSGKNYVRRKPIDDDPSYLRKGGNVPARAIAPMPGGEVVAFDAGGTPIRQANTRRPGQMPLAVEEQIINQNMQRRAGDFEREQDGLAQSRRRRAFINERDLQASKAVPRAVDAANLKANNTPGPIVPAAAPAPVQPVQPAQAPMPQAVAPAGPAATGAAEVANGAAVVSGAPPVPQAVAQPPVAAGTPAAVAPTAPAPAAAPPAVRPLSPAGQTAQTIIAAEGGVQGGYNSGETARLAGSANPVVSGTMQDTADIYSRMGAIPAIAAQGGDVGAYQRGQQVQAAQAQMYGNQQAEQAKQQQFVSGLPKAVPATPSRPSMPTDPERLNTLQTQMNAGQKAIDSGKSLDAQRREETQATERQYNVDLAKASTRPVGSTAQARPQLDPVLKVAVDAAASDLRAENAKYLAALEILANAKTEKDKEAARTAVDAAKTAVNDAKTHRDAVIKGTTPKAEEAKKPRKFTTKDVPAADQREDGDEITTEKGTFTWNGKGWIPKR